MSVDNSPQIKIVVVDNSPLTRKDAEDGLIRAIPGAVVEEISTEYGFRERLSEFVDTPPQLFVIGTRVRWTDPTPDIVRPPADVDSEGPLMAGSRLLRALQANPQTASVPTIMWGEYSLAFPAEGFNSVSIPGGASYVSKFSHTGERSYTAPLVRAAKRALNT